MDILVAKTSANNGGNEASNDAFSAKMTAEEIEKALRINELEWRHGYKPYVEYERTKRELEHKLDVLCDECQENGNKYLTKGK